MTRIVVRWIPKNRKFPSQPFKRMPHSREAAAFDTYAAVYDDALNQGLAVTGEDKSYFAEGRIRWLARCLRQLGLVPETVLDFGCGTGTATPYFLELINAQSVIGIDVSQSSLDVASQSYEMDPARFCLAADFSPAHDVDLVFCNGVFHHIPPTDRLDIARYIADCLKPGGIFAFWENNPWNPGTRYVMSRIPFDRDAITLTARTARSLLRSAGFEIVRTDYLFIFPRALRLLRKLEPFTSLLPLGAQYQVICRTVE